MQESAVKQFAVSRNLPVLQPEKLKDSVFLETLRSYQAELFVVVAFRMLPEEVWKMPPLGTVNLHASLLPQYRGAAPINWAIINGETCSGTTVFFINQEIDKGNIISYREVPIHPDDNAGTLHDRLMLSGANHLVEAVQTIASGNVKTLSQDSALQNQSLKSAPKIFRETCKIEWNNEVVQLHNLIRGLSPYPAAWTILASPKGDRLTLKIYETMIVPAGTSLAPAGTLRSDNKTFLWIAANDGWLAIRNLQLEGKKRMDIQDFLRGIQGIENYQTISAPA
jgi:methionyl-tRNA formyltransferase